MEKQIVDVPGLFDARSLGYVQVVTAGDIIFVSGQGGLDERVKLVSDEFETQAREALLNVRRAVQAAGGRAEDITAITVYLTDMSNLRAFGALKQEVLGDVRATSTTVEVSALALPGLLVEVTVMAVK